MQTCSNMIQHALTYPKHHPWLFVAILYLTSPMDVLSTITLTHDAATIAKELTSSSVRTCSFSKSIIAIFSEHRALAKESNVISLNK